MNHLLMKMKMIRTAKHPNFEEINPVLEQWINFLPQIEPDSYTNLVAAKRTSYCCYPQPFMDLGNWVAKTFNYNYDWDNAEVELWGAVYNKGHYAIKHGHGDPDNPEKHVVSFVYYVNAPEGSSPLVFADINQTFEPEAGLCITWDEDEEHEVPPNQCDNRIIVAGNFYSN